MGIVKGENDPEIVDPRRMIYKVIKLTTMSDLLRRENQRNLPTSLIMFYETYLNWCLFGHIRFKRHTRLNVRISFVAASDMRKRKGRSKPSETLNSAAEEEEVEHENVIAEGNGFFACYLSVSLNPRFKGHTYIR